MAHNKIVKRSHFREVVFEHNEHFPLVPVRFVDPGFVLARIAALCAYFVSRSQAFINPQLADGEHVFRGLT